MSPLRSKVMIVTGSSQGIGAELAKELRGRGAAVVTASRAEGFDVTDEASRVRLIESAIEQHGRIDGLINNAGRGSYFNALNAPLEDARDLFELNFFAPLRLAQLAAPHLIESHGSLVNVSSIAGLIALPWLPVYSASKFALAALTSCQRIELRRAGVHVMTVFPGYVDTGFQQNAAGSAPPPAVVKGRRFAVTAAVCARAIAGGLERRSHTVVTPRSGWLLIALNRIAPGLLESRMEGA